MSERRENLVREKSFVFALHIVSLVKLLQTEKKEFVLSKQLLRIWNCESFHVFSRTCTFPCTNGGKSLPPSIFSMSIVRWQFLEGDVLSSPQDEKSYAAIHPDVQELIKLLVSIVKTAKGIKN